MLHMIAQATLAPNLQVQLYSDGSIFLLDSSTVLIFGLQDEAVTQLLDFLQEHETKKQEHETKKQ